jgi:hypothetical protein
MRIPSRFAPCLEKCGWIDLARTQRRVGRLLSITHLGTYRVVLTQPPNRRTGVVLNLRYVITVTCASLRAVFGEVVGSISRAQNVDPAGS